MQVRVINLKEALECGAEMLGWELDELISRTILALRTFY